MESSDAYRPDVALHDAAQATATIATSGLSPRFMLLGSIGFGVATSLSLISTLATGWVSWVLFLAPMVTYFLAAGIACYVSFRRTGVLALSMPPMPAQLKRGPMIFAAVVFIGFWTFRVIVDRMEASQWLVVAAGVPYGAGLAVALWWFGRNGRLAHEVAANEVATNAEPA
ncbi:MAG: hypothetical protein ACK5KO_09395 [Arachnia sp.]